MTSFHHWNQHQIQSPRTKYGVQEEIEGKTVAAASMCFSGEVSRDIEKYDIPLKDVPTVSETTEYTSANGRCYILMLNEALYMNDMENTIINPNQCRHL